MLSPTYPFFAAPASPFITISDAPLTLKTKSTASVVPKYWVLELMPVFPVSCHPLPLPPPVPAGPCAPVSPFSPLSPLSPLSPFTPAPVSPFDPGGPTAPSVPGSPLSPFGPWSPNSVVHTVPLK